MLVQQSWLPCSGLHGAITMTTYRPVVVEMTQLVGQPLHVVRLQPPTINDHVEMCR